MRRIEATTPRVTGLERTVIRVPFTPRCAVWNAREIYNWQVCEVVTLQTDASGITGVGETLLHYTWSRVPEDAAERVTGRPLADLLGDDTLGAGLQMAVYDACGKALGVPLYRLLTAQRVREWCPISWWNIDMPAADLAAEACDAARAGYTAHKIKARPWWDIFEQVDAIASATPDWYRLDIDWNNMLLNAGAAVPVLQELDRRPKTAIYESPIMHHDVEGARQVRAKVARPIALHFGDPPFPVAVRGEVCDGFVVSGGIVSVLRQATLAAAFEKPFWLQLVGTGLTTALSAHLGAVLPFAQWPAVSCMNNFADDLVVEPLTVAGGLIRVPGGPGLGVELDRAAVDRLRMAPPYEVAPERELLAVSRPGCRTVYYSNMRQCWTDAYAGTHPVQSIGARMECLKDDGSSQWRSLYDRTLTAPVVD